MPNSNNKTAMPPLPAGVMRHSVYQLPHLTRPVQDSLAEEVPVALVYNGISHVVMMASPKDLELFAIGFSLSKALLNTRVKSMAWTLCQPVTDLKCRLSFPAVDLWG